MLTKRDLLRSAALAAVTASTAKSFVEIKSPLILQPGPAALTDGLDAIVKALWPVLPADQVTALTT